MDGGSQICDGPTSRPAIFDVTKRITRSIMLKFIKEYEIKQLCSSYKRHNRSKFLYFFNGLLQSLYLYVPRSIFACVSIAIDNEM